jgi:hypothetical protein
MLSVSTSSVSMASFTSLGLDLLAEILRRAADHESGDEDGEHDKDEHAVKTCADTADDDFAESIMNSGTSPPSGVKESCIEFTAPQEAAVVMVANRDELKMPKRTSLPSMLPSAAAMPSC